MSVIEFEHVTNARDLGGIPVTAGHVVAPGLFFRGSALSKASSADACLLRDGLRVDTVIDVRCGYEREAKPNVVIEGVQDIHLPFFDKDLVGIEYVKPLPNTKIIGHDFACDPDDFYASMPNPLTSRQIAKALHLIFERACEGKPTYYHCSGGKDRAGALTALALTILGAEKDAILEDYLLTNVSRDKQYDAIYARFLRLCEDEDRAREITDAHKARPENLTAFYRAIDKEYGSMDAYLHGTLGFSNEDIAHIRSACTVRA